MKAIIGTIPSDSHSWNLVFMQMLLQEENIDAQVLGICTPYEAYARAIQTHRPQLIVVSSINGHGFSQGQDIPAFIRGQAREPLPPIVIGGKLVTGNDFDRSKEQALLRAGFDKVYWSDSSITEFIAYVRGIHAQALAG